MAYRQMKRPSPQLGLQVFLRLLKVNIYGRTELELNRLLLLMAYPHQQLYSLQIGLIHFLALVKVNIFGHVKLLTTRMTQKKTLLSILTAIKVKLG